MKICITPFCPPVSVQAKAAADKPKWWAYYQHGNQVIAIDPTLSADKQGEYLIHECIHAIWAHDKLPPRVSEETVATKIAAALARVLTLNPHVGHALIGALHHNQPIVNKGE